MKQITELDEQEILALTTDELERMVKIKMAEEGIKILNQPLLPQYGEMPKKADRTYEIGGCLYLTKDEKIAKKIGEFLMQFENDLLAVTYGSGYSHQIVKPLSEYSPNTLGRINAKDFYTQEQINGFKAIEASNKELKTDYEAQLKEYHEAQENADTIRCVIYGRYNEVIKKYSEMEGMKSRYSDYLQIADNDAEMAMRFLKKAYFIDSETEAFITGIPETKSSLLAE